MNRKMEKSLVELGEFKEINAVQAKRLILGLVFPANQLNLHIESFTPTNWFIFSEYTNRAILHWHYDFIW